MLYASKSSGTLDLNKLYQKFLPSAPPCPQQMKSMCTIDRINAHNTYAFNLINIIFHCPSCKKKIKKNLLKINYECKNYTTLCKHNKIFKFSE